MYNDVFIKAIQHIVYLYKSAKTLFVLHFSSVAKMKAVWIVVAFAILDSTCQLVKADDRVCSSTCNSVGTSATNPGKSCDEIYQVNEGSRGVSGDYYVETPTGVHKVYCDMELECDGHKGGWMRIVDLDTSRGDDCPSKWSKFTTPDNSQYPSIDVCQSPTTGAGCFPTTFSVHNSSYSKICGKARGYQRATTDAFSLHTGNKNIDGAYVDGLSITLGYPRKHVWTYAVGISGGANLGPWTCPCAAFPGASPHAFVGNNYYCDSGTAGTQQSIIYTNDPLWDGDGCAHVNDNCCADPSMPWFFRQFTMPQSEDIEARLCRDESYNNEATVIDQLQLYVM